MPRAPVTGDCIHKDLITDKAMLKRLHEQAKRQDRTLGQWHRRDEWDYLRYYDGTWRWHTDQGDGVNITPDVILGPEPLVPGSWVERKDSIKNEWVKRWFVGYNSEGKLITEHGKHPDEFITNNPDQVRPYRDAEQRAIDKLQADGHIVTKEMTRTVKMLNTLGLLKD